MKYSSLLLTACFLSAPAFADFSLSSNDIKPGKMMAMEQVYNGFGCTGKNLSPQLSWDKAPSGTKSFAITAYDPDAPTGSGWWHWIAFNIPASVNSLDSGAMARAVFPNQSAAERWLLWGFVENAPSSAFRQPLLEDEEGGLGR